MELFPWIASPQPDPEQVAQLMKDAELTELVASLLVQRGITTRKAAKEFLHPSYSNLHNPTEMKDMEKAGRRLLQAIDNDEAEHHPATAHMFIINPLSGARMDNLFSTHPAVENRIAALRDLSQRMGGGGFTAPRPAPAQPRRGPWG